MTKERYLKSRQRRGKGRWFHYYRRNGVEKSLGVHGLLPEDPKVKAAYWAEHARWQDMPPDTQTPKANTFAWGLDIYLSGSDHWSRLALETQKNRLAIFKRYVANAGDRPLASITVAALEAGLYERGGHGAVSELKALAPVFRHLAKLRIIPRNPADGIKLEKPKTVGFPTASADEIAAFIKRWPVGTTERLVFDLGLYTGAARIDLAKLGRKDIDGTLLSFVRTKSNTPCHVPITKDLRAVIDRTPDISPTFILNRYGRPYSKEGLGNLYRQAAVEAGIKSRLHGLRKAFCTYWAEQGKSAHQISAMSGHLSLAEVQRYTRAVDRKKIIQLLAGAS